jgi:hypothetical protein
MSKNTLKEQEDILFEKLQNTYSPEEQELLVQDGLCTTAITNKQAGIDAEALWTQSKKRVMFLLKEPNGNPGEDYRDWDWSANTELFGNVLAYWLEGLNIVDKDNLPIYDNLSWRKDIMEQYPLVIVNLKKLSGDSIADWNEIREYANRDREFLKEQVRNILNPNIVVCGGSSGSNSVLSLAREFIYNDINFEKINNWCYYNKDNDILLIDSYHPSMPGSYKKMVDDMLFAVQQFIIKNNEQH